MAIPIDQFILSLTFAIANEVVIDPMIPPFAFFSMEAVETKAAPVYSVVRMYGGDSKASFAGSRVPSAAIQVDTRGQVASEVLLQAHKAYEALLDDQDRPRFLWMIDGKRENPATNVVEADPEGDWQVISVMFNQVPGITGRDDASRSIATFNFDVDFQRVPST